MRCKVCNQILAAICFISLLLSVFATPVFSRYILSDSGVVLTSKVEGSVYTVTYMNGSDVYGVDYVWDNSKAYTSIASAPGEKPDDRAIFEGWKYLDGQDTVTTIPAGNTSNHVLYASWTIPNKHTIRFVDADATLLYQEVFEEGASNISSQGQSAVDAILIDLENKANVDTEKTKITFTVSWEDYSLRNAKDDVTVRAVYTMKAGSGSATITPVYGENGEVDYYKVEATSGLSGEVTIPGMIGGVPVTRVEDISSDTINTGLTKVIFLEGVEVIGANSMAMTSALGAVELPNSLKEIGSNAFASTWGGSLISKDIEIIYNGTWEEWKNVNKANGWDSGLASGSTIVCKDGTATLSVSGGFLGYGATYTWTFVSN